MPLSSEKIIILDTTGSSNNYAMGLIKTREATHGTAIFAIEQSAGKGRLTKTWDSQPGANVILSVITDMVRVSIDDRFLLSMVASLSVAGLIEQETGIQAFVKWPNDVFLNDRKTAGVLIENVIRGTIWQWSVTGFGVNVNQTAFAKHLHATSLQREAKKEFDVLKLAKQLRDSFLKGVEALQDGDKWDIARRYNERLYKRGERVKLQAGGSAFDAVISGVSEDGKLITADPLQREWTLDEVRMIME